MASHQELYGEGRSSGWTPFSLVSNKEGGTLHRAVPKNLPPDRQLEMLLKLYPQDAAARSADKQAVGVSPCPIDGAVKQHPSSYESTPDEVVETPRLGKAATAIVRLVEKLDELRANGDTFLYLGGGLLAFRVVKHFPEWGTEVGPLFDMVPDIPCTLGGVALVYYGIRKKFKVSTH